MPNVYVAGRGARFRSDALRHRALRLKQLKIDARLRLCLGGLDTQCCNEAMSNMVKTVKDHDVTKTYLNGPRTPLRLRPNLHFHNFSIILQTLLGTD